MGDTSGFTREEVTWVCKDCQSEVTVRSRGLSDCLKRMPLGWVNQAEGWSCPYCQENENQTYSEWMGSQ